jgi:hypothetical protein
MDTIMLKTSIEKRIFAFLANFKREEIDAVIEFVDFLNGLYKNEKKW